MAYVKKDLKSPRDLAVYLKSRSLTISTATKDHVEEARNLARDYDGQAPAIGRNSEVGMEDFMGVLRIY